MADHCISLSLRLRGGKGRVRGETLTKLCRLFRLNFNLWMATRTTRRFPRGPSSAANAHPTSHSASQSTHLHFGAAPGRASSASHALWPAPAPIQPPPAHPDVSECPGG